MIQELERRSSYHTEIAQDVAQLGEAIRTAAASVATVKLVTVPAMLAFMVPVEALLARIKSNESAVFKKMQVGKLAGWLHATPRVACNCSCCAYVHYRPKA